MQHLNFEAMNHVPSTGVSLCLVVPNPTVEGIARAPCNVTSQGDPVDAVETERPGCRMLIVCHIVVSYASAVAK